MKHVGFENVELLSGFWKDRWELNEKISIKSVLDRFEETGRMDSLRYVYDGTQDIHKFYGSDVAKWIEAVSYLIRKKRNGYKEYEKIIDSLVVSCQKNQREDGYLNSFFQQVDPENIFTRRDDHELYCAGHLIEAAIAYFEATGKREFLDVMLKCVDCIERFFIIEKTAKFSTPGHEEIEIALLRLYKLTKDEKHLSMAKHFIFARGKDPSEPGYRLGNEKYTQNNLPAVDLQKAEGHAVRATYFYTAMADYAKLCNDKKMHEACRRLYSDIMTKMYITGGIGSARLGESFTVSYDLPNLTAYSESCAAIGLMMFSRELNSIEENAEYGDVIERVMYNGFLSSTSLDGKAFFYENPLEIRLNERDKETSIQSAHRTVLPRSRRLEVFNCSCCPPNINRVVASIANYIYSRNDEELYIHQFISSSYDGIKMQTNFPTSGKVNLRFDKSTISKLAVRKPFWCDSFTLKIDGVMTVPQLQNGYIRIDIGNVTDVTIDFEMKVKLISANPKVAANSGRVAVMRGPVVYCLESVDNGENLNAISLKPTARFKIDKTDKYKIPNLITTGFVDVDFDGLYTEFKDEKMKKELKFIPYFAFANREECDMIVWLRVNSN